MGDIDSSVSRDVDQFEKEKRMLSKPAPINDLTKDVLITDKMRSAGARQMDIKKTFANFATQKDAKQKAEESKRKFYASKVKGLKKAAKEVYKGTKKVASAIAKTLNEPQKLSASEKLMRRKAQAARMRQVMMERKGAIAASQQGYDNKFERQLVANKMKLDEEEARRRFHEIPTDFLLRRAMLRDLQLKRQKDWQMRNNMFREHQRGIKVRLNLLNVDAQTNLMSTPAIWNPDNPDNNVFDDGDRPTILDAPNRFAVTDESRRWNILNAQKLNWGNVDTRRRPRKFRLPKEDDYGTSQGQF